MYTKCLQSEITPSNFLKSQILRLVRKNWYPDFKILAPKYTKINQWTWTFEYHVFIFYSQIKFIAMDSLVLATCNTLHQDTDIKQKQKEDGHFQILKKGEESKNFHKKYYY